MSETGKAPLLKALARERTERVPLWIMRQAGRYLPEYRALRQKAGSFLKLCMTPELACMATLQPVERFNLDAAILFSDILVVPDALGCRLAFEDGEGPMLNRPVRNEDDVCRLGEIGPEDLRFQQEAIRLCKRQLTDGVPLIGFAGAPLTLACYMIDGRGGEFLLARAMMHSRPDLFSSLLSSIARAVFTCLREQAKAGADALMIFESWAGLVPLTLAREILVEPLAWIASSLRESGIDTPLIAFQRGASDIAELTAGTGVDALGIDWRSDFGELSSRVGDKVALQGNLDPAVLLGDQATVRREALKVLRSHRHKAGHVFNLGHGIHKDTPIESVETLVETVSGFRRDDE